MSEYRNGALRLLDLFCGAGGCTKGYQMAGFHVTGVDLKASPRYCGDEFYQADALEFLAEHGHEYDAIHASPPCQAYCALKNMWNGREHPDLVEPTRELLEKTGRPYVIENVPGAPLKDYFLLCGSMFGLRTSCGAQLRRHRLFETNWFFGFIPECDHTTGSIGVWGATPRNPGAEKRKYCKKGTISVTGTGQPVGSVVISIHGDKARDRRRCITVTGHTPQNNSVRNMVREVFTTDDARDAMGIPWMTMKELSQAIPPAYTHWIGVRLMEQLRAEAVA